MQVHSEGLNARAETSAQLFSQRRVDEALKFHNVFRAVHRTPVFEADRARRVELVKKIDMIERASPMLRFFSERKLRRLNTELEDIPMAVVSEDTFPNLVPDIAANHCLDSWLAGSAYTVVGPYLLLISSVSYTTGPANGDTMASHGGWTEAGATNAPTYSGTRKTAAFSSAAARTKALSANVTFNFTGAGTTKGVAMVLGTGAVSTIDNTAGTLGSAGLFTGGDKVVGSGDSLSVGYSVAV